MVAHENKREARREAGARGRLSGMSGSDKLLVALSVLLLVTLGLASLYGFKYGRIDESVLPGKFTLVHDGAEVLSIDIASKDDVTVNFGDFVVHGKLALEGADTQSVLYKLTDRTYSTGLDPENTALLLRVPRGGLQGDFTGPWMVYHTLTKTGAKKSIWTMLNEDGTGYFGRSTSTNPMVTQYPQLEKASKKVTWQRDGNRVSVSSGQ